jgi:hypothetical protein
LGLRGHAFLKMLFNNSWWAGQTNIANADFSQMKQMVGKAQIVRGELAWKI